MERYALMAFHLQIYLKMFFECLFPQLFEIKLPEGNIRLKVHGITPLRFTWDHSSRTARLYVNLVGQIFC